MTLESLLVVQAHDTAMDQLGHKLKTLPEYQALADIADERAHLDAKLAEVGERRHELARDQKRIEDDVALIEARHDKDSARLYSGEVTAHKELQLLQDELRTLGTRRSTLEDQILEIMEAAEPLDREIGEAETAVLNTEERKATVEQALAAASAEIEAEIASEQEQRQTMASEIESDLLATYERAREACGGVGVSRLVAKTCQGCHLQLAAIEYDRIRKSAADVISYCDCGRLLVHQ